ncbi:MAG: sulfotransferase family protein [Alphaproteobacteria bacterium]|nr:MAG: sulfotransferase family protein [Alphaproteobacteria bacterium]
MDEATKNEIRAAFDNIVRLIQAGQTANAAEAAKMTLRRFPNEPNILRVLGVAQMRLGQGEEAEKNLKTSIKIVPNHPATHEQLGTLYFSLGRLKEAEAAFRHCVKLDPSNRSAQAKLGRTLSVMGNEDEAEKLWERALEHNPQWRDLTQALQKHRVGEQAEARKILRTVLQADPDNVDALRLMGSVAIAEGKFNDAEALLRRVVELTPDFALALANLGHALQEQSKYGEAEEVFRRAHELEPTNPSWLANLGGVFVGSGREEGALEFYRQALELNPKHAGALMSIGHVLKTIGKQDEAIEAYRKGAEERPDLGEIYWSLANLKTFRFTDDEMVRMQDQVESGRLNEESEINFLFALGKAYEDREDYEKAFNYYQAGNAKKRMIVHHDPSEFQYAIDRITEIFTPEFFAEREGWGFKDPAPILILGLPRSGSTLVEQILSSHSQVDGTMELPDLLRLASSTGRNRSDGVRYPDALLDLDRDYIEDLGRDYIENTAKHRGAAPFFTDKMPNNFPHIGFLHLILPNAKVIDARRHPLDSCLGTWKQLFAKGQPFSYDFFDLAEYYKQYMRIMAHWDAVLPGKVLHVQYEDNVENLEPQARAMLEHCGLPWDDSVLRFYESERSVKTASSEQVRQPIYTKAKYFWKNYEPWLGDLIEDLMPIKEDLPATLEWPELPD